MLVNLKNLAAQNEETSVNLELEERLPPQLLGPCQITCHFSVQRVDNYYVLDLSVNSNLTSVCQRCLKEFSYPYNNQTRLAIVDSEAMADRLMEQYECVVSDGYQVNLKELVTDELHLYAPQMHDKISDCDSEMKHFIVGEH
ncbi:metal-binding protein [Legionella jordanis]|uniref:YceD family protein n=1 Tax=Legionella jordanis TaxID=456 RepID=UPI000EFDC10F|nr:YceD family protein [Legionella jordanis]RMX18404.1 metal-binding protein [Legionella jordanis]